VRREGLVEVTMKTTTQADSNFHSDSFFNNGEYILSLMISTRVKTTFDVSFLMLGENAAEYLVQMHQWRICNRFICIRVRHELMFIFI
jgi:hypothetical protein